MEVWEFEAIQEAWEKKHREELLLWRMQAYYQAAHFFDPKKDAPKVQDWFPFDWEEAPDPRAKWIPYSEQIRMMEKVGWKHRIPAFWYIEAEKECKAD